MDEPMKSIPAATEFIDRSLLSKDSKEKYKEILAEGTGVYTELNDSRPQLKKNCLLR